MKGCYLKESNFNNFNSLRQYLLFFSNNQFSAFTLSRKRGSWGKGGRLKSGESATDIRFGDFSRRISGSTNNYKHRQDEESVKTVLIGPSFLSDK